MIDQELLSNLDTGLWLVDITWTGHWPLIGRERSSDLITGLWLVINALWCILFIREWHQVITSIVCMMIIELRKGFWLEHFIKDILSTAMFFFQWSFFVSSVQDKINEKKVTFPSIKETDGKAPFVIMSVIRRMVNGGYIAQ